jgi:hypothetical protein
VEPIIDHIQITVKDMSVAEPFYDKLLPVDGELQIGGISLIMMLFMRDLVVLFIHLVGGSQSPTQCLLKGDSGILRRQPGFLKAD